MWPITELRTLNSYGYALILIYFYTEALFSSFSYSLIRCIDFMGCVLSCFSHVQPFATLWTRAYQAPLSMGFSRQEYWSGLPFPSPGDLPNPRIQPVSHIAGRRFNLWATREAQPCLPEVVASIPKVSVHLEASPTSFPLLEQLFCFT